MLLLKDQQTPKKLDDFVINRKTALTLKNLSRDGQLFNLILNGMGGIGKYTLARAYLAEIYGDAIYKTKSVSLKIKNKEIEIIQSNFHYEIILTPYFLNDKQTLNNIILNLGDNLNISTLSHNIFLIKNIDLLDSDSINMFKKIVERYYETSKFIIISKNGSKINKLSGCCNFIRVSTPEVDDVIEFFETKTLIPIKNTENEKIIKETPNLNVVFSKIELNTLGVNRLINILEDHLKIILNLVYSLKPTNLIKIREEIYFIICKNFDKNIFFHYIVNNIIKNKKIYDVKKLQIINSATKYQHRMSISYREIIHIEAFMIDVMNILST
jgi:hypothetical protein